ncbi:formylmethanofuran-tetrahydromethanopterin formyltransferase [Methanothermus fervidus DSM 2088]|uniref:Formylmethanofuran-tetrahydromethanopterin formyltransferase n=1 Tax=Methanothermus fervidus (strain ATCC 43054 / DSM 2088 / JCM 10308 / V24 S) TaxID=523846 RepID=E3GWC5_METFV|nr:formylmethanofuran--tetrahydromethanopterin N-formyltransferase [Methanothermus fervidus]ADP77890.1 formylmethanofuran-tetrahydromethanopterin formyltransferase [Methanothermus fervidus DSM 2088]
MYINDVFIEDTFCEAFYGVCARVLITAEDKNTLKKAAYDATSTPGAVIGRIEGGVEKFVDKSKTPDGRPGAILQFWFGKKDLKKFEVELSYRIRQDILVKPFTTLFNLELDADGHIDTMKYVGHCGDGYEWEEELYGRKMIVVPITVPDFKIERKIGYQKGIMGANFWYMCETKEAVLEAGEKIIKAINKIDYVITPFDVCSAASKPETNYPWIGPTTNHPYCPSLKSRLGKDSKVPEGVKYIPEIVINGLKEDKIKEAMKVGIEAATTVDGVLRISAGNYGGKLGEYKLRLYDVLK